jgi:hypothetical protein
LLETRLKKLEVLLAPPEPTYLEILRAAQALNAQRKAEGARGATHPTNGGITHEH